MRSYVCIAAAILTCSVCSGQSVSIGGIGGGMLTNDLNDQWVSSVSMRYVIGPELNIGLPLGFGIEADALYRHESFRTLFVPEQSPRNSWEFPLLLKYRLPFPLVKPFLEAGYAPRVINGSIGEYASASHGIVIGGGVQFGIGRLHLSPVVRFTHWNNGGVVLVIPNGPTIQSTQNQVDILVGIGWKIR